MAAVQRASPATLTAHAMIAVNVLFKLRWFPPNPQLTQLLTHLPLYFVLTKSTSVLVVAPVVNYIQDHMAAVQSRKPFAAVMTNTVVLKDTYVI